MSLNILDIILLLCFIPALVNGFRKGLIDQIISIGSLFLGVFLAYRWAVGLSIELAPYFETTDPALHKILSFFIILVVVFIVMKIIGALIDKLLKITTLGWLNSLLGLAFSILVATIVIGLLLMGLTWLNTKVNFISQEVLESSRVYEWLTDFTNKIFPYLKGAFQNNVI